jgi:hypothetical protein
MNKKEIKNIIEFERETYSKIDKSLKDAKIEANDLTGEYAFKFGYVDGLYRRLLDKLEVLSK